MEVFHLVAVFIFLKSNFVCERYNAELFNGRVNPRGSGRAGVSIHAGRADLLRPGSVRDIPNTFVDRPDLTRETVKTSGPGLRVGSRPVKSPAIMELLKCQVESLRENMCIPPTVASVARVIVYFVSWLLRSFAGRSLAQLLRRNIVVRQGFLRVRSLLAGRIVSG